MRRLALVIATALILLALPATAAAAEPTYPSTYELVKARGRAMTAEINQHRVDLRGHYQTAKTAYYRAVAMARAGTAWHDLKPIKAMFDKYDICYRNVGEAIGYTTRNMDTWGAAQKADYFVALWRNSPDHWPMLSATRYNRGSGSWYDAGARIYFVYYVWDPC